MRVGVCGQLRLAVGLVRAPENGVLDQIAGAVDWAALEVVPRSLRNRGSHAGGLRDNRRCCCAACCWGCGAAGCRTHHPVLAPRPKRRNRRLAQVRFAVEQPFAVFKERYGLRRLRLFTQACNHVQVLLACCAYTLRRAAGVGAGSWARSARRPPSGGKTPDFGRHWAALAREIRGQTGM